MMHAAIGEILDYLDYRRRGRIDRMRRTGKMVSAVEGAALMAAADQAIAY